MKSTIISNKLQPLDFGKVVVVGIVVITLGAQKALNEVDSQCVILSEEIPGKIQIDSDDTSYDNDSYLRTNIDSASKVWFNLSLGRSLIKYSISDIASESDRRELSDVQM